MKNKSLLLWGGFTGLIFISFLISLALSPKLTFSTSLLDILPASSSLHEIEKADLALADKTGRSVTILTKAHSLKTAKLMAEKFYQIYRGTTENPSENQDYFESLSLYVNSASISEVTRWLHQNRYMLLDDKSCSLLETGRESEIAEDALASIYGAFNFSDLSYLEEDPFLLSERVFQRFLNNGALSSTSMALQDDVLTAEKDDFTYVLIRGSISKQGSSLTGKDSSVAHIYKSSETIKKEIAEPDIDFIFSGMPFHSYENASSAQKQIKLISFASLFVIIFLFLFLFHSFIPAVLSSLSVVLSCLTGLVSVLLFFRVIHVLTFVFGTTLIGTCLDYSIHFFVNWTAHNDCKTGKEVREHIFRGVTLGFLSTEICFAALFFTPFLLLKQVSLFLFTGLASSYLTVMAIYPLLKLRNNKNKAFICKLHTGKPHFTRGACFNKAIRILPILLSVISLIIIVVNKDSYKIRNNIRELYSLSPGLLKNEITSAQVLNTGSNGAYFIVKGQTEEEVLERNDEVTAFLDKLKAEGKLKSYLSVSQFIPSQKRQSKSYRAAEKLLAVTGEQYEALGFTDLSSDYEKNYNEMKNHFISISRSDYPSVIKDAVSTLWIGQTDSAFYSCIMPLHLSRGEEVSLSEYANQTSGVYFVNKVEDISKELDRLSKNMLLMLGISFLFVLLILLFCYQKVLVLKIAFVQLAVMLTGSAVLLLFNISISFFPIAAFILVFGLGLDYVIYAIEAELTKEKADNSLTGFAIILSFVTTALSFGALAFSTFPPVHMLGLTVFTGLTAAVITSFCITSKR